jgi:ABC-type amino acid transport substrate-binding protein
MRYTSLLFLGFILFFTLGLRGQMGPDTLNVGIYKSPPFVMEHPGGYTGVSIALWQQISERVNRPFRYVLFSDGVALQRALVYENIDIGINPEVPTGYRVANFEMTQPFFSSGVGVVTAPQSQSQFVLFIRNFFSMAFLRIILLLFGILLVFGTLLWIVERRKNPYQFRKGLWGLFDGLWWAAVTMTTVGYGDKAPKSHVGKGIAIVWMFTAIIIISSFTATIASTLTVNTLESDIRGLDDLLTQERIGVVGNSEAAQLLLENDVAPTRYFTSVQQGLRALGRKEVDVLLHERTALAFSINQMGYSGRVSLLPFVFRRQYRSFQMPFEHPDFRIVNQAMQEVLGSATWDQNLAEYGLER